MKSIEANFDGLIGPTHNYAGLSVGNIASMGNKKQTSSPKQAALQGLSKMKTLADMGFVQGVLAPQERPSLRILRQLGFSGNNDHDVISQAEKVAPGLLASLSSASSMWTANAATISPSADTQDHKLHMTPANLVNKFHRFIEPPTTSLVLKATFPSEKYFVHHEPLPSHESFGDEGAANHTRFCREYGDPGVELFVFGRYGEIRQGVHPQKFPARQSFEASQAIARLHGLKENKIVYAQQNPNVIDEGVFHNDVIAVGNGDCLLYHELAYIDAPRVIDEIQKKLGFSLNVVKVRISEISVEEAVNSYLFNSQLLCGKDGKMILVVPEESRTTPSVWNFLCRLIEDSQSPINKVIVKDVKQSMKNGGGPACLRLRVVLSPEELAAVNQKTLLTPELYENLVAWVNSHYRNELTQDDLADPLLLDESRQALDELTSLLGLGSIYDFQK